MYIAHVILLHGYCAIAYGGLVNTKEQHSGVDVVHRCFSEGGNSILLLEALAREAARLLNSDKVT
jgi:hypothetical protein